MDLELLLKLRKRFISMTVKIGQEEPFIMFHFSHCIPGTGLNRFFFTHNKYALLRLSNSMNFLSSLFGSYLVDLSET